MKIVFIVPKIINCGPVNVVLSLVNELSLDLDSTIVIVSVRENNDSTNYIDKFKQLGVKSFFSLDKYPNLIGKVSYLREIVRDADVVHSHGFFPDLYSSFFLRNNLNRVSTAHCIFYKDYLLEYGSVKGFSYASLHHIIYWLSSFEKIVGCSNSVKNYLCKLTPLFNKRIISIHNGVDRKSFFKVSQHRKLLLKADFMKNNFTGYISEDSIFVYAGRLIRRKRVPEMIEWFLDSSFSQDNTLVILGDGEEMGICVEAARGHKNILFMGFMDDVTPFYQIADYLLSFSSFEGFPMSVLEGLSCGCKAILSDIPSHREIIDYFPTMATLNKDFSLDTLKFSWSEESAYYLSSVRMAEEYKSIYNCES